MDILLEAEMLITFGYIYYEEEEYIKAKEYFQNAVEICKKNGMERIIIFFDLYIKYSKEVPQIQHPFLKRYFNEISKAIEFRLEELIFN